MAHGEVEEASRLQGKRVLPRMHQVDRQAVRFIGPEDQANVAGPHRWRGLVGQRQTRAR